jgi:hypothetical protein
MRMLCWSFQEFANGEFSVKEPTSISSLFQSLNNFTFTKSFEKSTKIYQVGPWSTQSDTCFLAFWNYFSFSLEKLVNPLKTFTSIESIFEFKKITFSGVIWIKFEFFCWKKLQIIEKVTNWQSFLKIKTRLRQILI